MQNGDRILIGDANGADKAVQRYLHAHGYEQVEVFCVEGSCRNNLGNWPVRSVVPSHRRKDFAYYAAKDQAMAEKAAWGLMLWDGESLGTLANVFRLRAQAKHVLVFEGSSKRFRVVKSQADWQRLLSQCPSDVRQRLQKQVSGRRSKTQPASQLALF
jgi:adenine-specific DNA-methyltransferase